MVNLAQEFTSAQYSLTPNELKAWILFIASIEKPEYEGVDSVYIFNALDFADKMGIDKRKARGKIVANLFVRLSKSFIDIRSREYENGEQDIFHSNFISSVHYNAKNYRIEISIPTTLRPYLFKLREGTFTRLFVKDIMGLSTSAAIHIFLYLQNLNRIGQYTIPIPLFRQETGFTQPAYNDFYELKRRVLIPSVKEIRRHTTFKDFFIEDNGARGRRATVIHFGFEKESINDDLFLGIDQNVAAYIQKKFSHAVQIVIRLAIDKGFNPRYIRDKFDGIHDDVIVANFNYVLGIISKEKRQGKGKPASVYGRYFIKAVTEDWAEANGATKEMLKKSHMEDIVADKGKDLQERDELQDLTEYYRKEAKKFVAGMDFKTLCSFIKKNEAALNNLAGRNSFNMEHALSRKKTYREFRLMTQLAIGQMMSGEITVPKKTSLFEKYRPKN